MKVGFLKTAPPDSDQESGVTTYLNELMPALGSHGVDTSVFWFKGPGAGAPHRPYRASKGAWGRYRDIHRPNARLAASLREWVGAEKPDLLHCHWAADRMMALLRDVPRSFPPVIMSFHTFEAVCPLKTHVTRSGELCREVPGTVCLREGCRSLKKWLMHDVMLRRLRNKHSHKAALYIVHNAEAGQFAERAGFRPVRHLRMGTARDPVREIIPRGPVLLYVGRLRQEKGVYTIMEALRSVFREVPDAEMRFAGDGEEAGRLREAATAFGGRVRLLGAIDPEALNREYARARAVLMPSEWKENFGLVGVEAMSFGTPVISSLVGGIPQWLRPGFNGLAFDRGNPESLARQTLDILRNGELARRLGRGALATAAEFNMHDHAGRMAGVYREVLGR